MVQIKHRLKYLLTATFIVAVLCLSCFVPVSAAEFLDGNLGGSIPSASTRYNKVAFFINGAGSYDRGSPDTVYWSSIVTPNLSGFPVFKSGNSRAYDDNILLGCSSSVSWSVSGAPYYIIAIQCPSRYLPVAVPGSRDASVHWDVDYLSAADVRGLPEFSTLVLQGGSDSSVPLSSVDLDESATYIKLTCDPSSPTYLDSVRITFKESFWYRLTGFVGSFTDTTLSLGSGLVSFITSHPLCLLACIVSVLGAILLIIRSFLRGV